MWRIYFIHVRVERETCLQQLRPRRRSSHCISWERFFRDLTNWGGRYVMQSCLKQKAERKAEFVNLLKFLDWRQEGSPEWQSCKWGVQRVWSCWICAEIKHVLDPFPAPVLDYMAGHLNLPRLHPRGSIMIILKSHHFNSTIVNYTTQAGIWLMLRVNLIIKEDGRLCTMSSQRNELLFIFLQKRKKD